MSPRLGEREERKSPAEQGFRSAPKRTRTSTRLSRTRPSTWRVYQFRHRRKGGAEYSPGPLEGRPPQSSSGCSSRQRSAAASALADGRPPGSGFAGGSFEAGAASSSASASRSLSLSAAASALA